MRRESCIYLYHLQYLASYECTSQYRTVIYFCTAHTAPWCTEQCQFSTEKCQFSTEKCQFSTEKCQFRTENCQFRWRSAWAGPGIHPGRS
jgi:hypothetical protein